MIDSEASARAWLAGLADAAALARLEALMALLLDENSRQNLVSAASLGDAWRRHIADSAQLLGHVPRETSGEWVDLGSGAGFPGLVIAAMRPDQPITLIEQRPLRTEWLRRCCAVLELTNAEVVQSPVERVRPRNAAIISARALAALPRILELSAHLSTKQTLWLLPKGRSAAQELVALTGWRHRFHVEPSLTDAASGIVVGDGAERMKDKA